MKEKSVVQEAQERIDEKTRAYKVNMAEQFLEKKLYYEKKLAVINEQLSNLEKGNEVSVYPSQMG